jgi:predicted DsbA family dithiol-disulfide isomerase
MSMSTLIKVYSDFVCPFCYLAEQIMSDAIKGRNARIDWRAFELRPAPVPTLRPEDPYLPSVWDKAVYPAAQAMKIPIKLPSISPQPRSRKAFELLIHARKKGLAHVWTMAVFAAFFEHDQDIGDDDVLFDIAGSVGIDPDEARIVLRDGVYTEQHNTALAEARVLEVNVVPTIVVGDRIFRGMPSREALIQALDEAESSAAHVSRVQDRAVENRQTRADA